MSRLVALLLSSTVVIVGGKWIGSVCLLGDRARKALEDPVHTVCCHAAGFEAIYPSTDMYGGFPIWRSGPLFYFHGLLLLSKS